MPQMWIPPGGDPMVQSVLMDKPEPLTAEQYQAKLVQKLNRMAREMTPEAQESVDCH